MKKNSKEILQNLLNAKFSFNDENGNIMEVPKSGNLGLLAIGYKGLVAVRQKRKKENGK